METERPEGNEASARDLAAVVWDPVRFARGLLQLSLWAKQEEILRAIASGSRVAVKACHSSGKTFLAAAAVLWWLTRYPDGIVVTTAPSWVQVEKLLWGEIHRAMAKSRIGFPEANKTELRLGPNHYAIGLSTNEGIRFQGFHGRVLIVIDEAPGVKGDIWEAIEGIRAGGDVRVLALGNPTIASGPFYDAFTANREGWKTFSISAFDTPNLVGLTISDLITLSPEKLDIAPTPYLVSRRWVKEKWSEWGPGHPLWHARVLGEFPVQGDDALISLAWIEAAARREVADAGGKVHAGLDVAGPGEDETVLVITEGPNVLALQSWAQPDPRGAVLAALAPYGRELETLNVDTAGIGYYLAKHLEDLDLPVRFVNVGESAGDSERYRNLKAEFYWGLRMRLEAGDMAGLTDEKTIGQLAGIRYRHNARGQVEIESKDDARKRGVKSPDRAEAVMLAFARPRRTWINVNYEEPDPNPVAQQLRPVLPESLRDKETCGTCEHFLRIRGNEGTCTYRPPLDVTADLIECEWWQPA